MVEKCSNGGANFFPAGWHVAAKPCDSCMSAPALLFCRKHTAFLCMACDVKLHGQIKHERVWLCEVCEHAPAVVTCKADAAALCVVCDRDIHSANPLASRHERFPVVTFYDSAQAVVTSIADNLLKQVSSYPTTELISSSVIPTTDMVNINVSFPSDTSPVVVKPIDLFSVADPFFDFGFAMPTKLVSQFHDPLNDCVVLPAQIADHKSTDFTRCVTNSYYKSSSQSYSQSVSSSSMDAGVVPEENSILEISNPPNLPENAGGTYCTQKVKQFCAIDRQARVLRYREKRKNRKFEKKIRYASRKAYAEMRPRIKGRFVKRTESQMVLDVDRWLFTAESNSNSFGAEVGYGVVPSF